MSHKGQWRLYAIAATLLICGAIPVLAGQKAQTNPWKPLNVKTGLWETTRTSTTTGEAPIPASMRQRLTPEQLARIEQRIKARAAAAKTRTNTDKHCVTKQDLENPPNFMESGQCTWSNLESSSTRGKGSVSCQMDGIKMTGSGDFEAPDQEHMTGLIHITSTDGSHNMTINGNFKSRWIGPSCGNLQR